jgi:hypothetical protein
MNLPRIFANAIARRVAYVVVAIALAWCGIGDASAQTYSCTSSPSSCTRPQAYAECQARGTAVVAPFPTGEWRCDVNLTEKRYTAFHKPAPHNSWAQTPNPNGFRWGTECPEGFTWDEETKSCNQPCQGLSPVAAGAAAAPGAGDSFCSGGCSYLCGGASVTLVIDGVQRTSCATSWNPTGSVCSANQPAPLTPVADTDGDGTSDPNDNSPNNPGESGDGSNQDESRACGGEGQPECAEDGSNAGSGNGNTSGGGGNCQTPPTSTGDAILAQIAFQTWATRCALEGNANEGDGTGTKPGEGKQPDWTKGDAPPVPTDDTDYVTDQTSWELPVSTDLLDQENIFGNASCPNFTIRVWTASVSTAEWGHWCTLANIMRVMITVFGAFTAIQILLGKW